VKRYRVFLLITALCGVGLRSDAQQVNRWVVEETRGEETLYSEFPLDVAGIWKQIDSVSNELKNSVGIESSSEPVEIVLFSTHASYVQYLSQKIPQARNRRAIFLRNGAVSQIYAWNSRTLMTDLRHEMVHVRIHQHLPFFPLWLDEGLAEYFEEEPGKRSVSSRRDSVRWKARLGMSPSLRALEGLPSAEAMNGETYRDSWAWVSFLINNSAESRDTLRKYVKLIYRGEAPGTFSSFAEAESPGLTARANSYFRKMTIVVTLDSSDR
jgi:hypothetical protein